MGSKVQSLAGHLANLPDPRKTRGQRHELLDIILIAVLAVTLTARGVPGSLARPWRG